MQCQSYRFYDYSSRLNLNRATKSEMNQRSKEILDCADVDYTDSIDLIKHYMLYSTYSIFNYSYRKLQMSHEQIIHLNYFLKKTDKNDDFLVKGLNSFVLISRLSQPMIHYPKIDLAKVRKIENLNSSSGSDSSLNLDFRSSLDLNF